VENNNFIYNTFFDTVPTDMPKPDHNTSDDHSFEELNSPASVEMKQLMEQIENSHDLLYKMINLEMWALAETMDEFIPGFWSRFLENRRLTLKQFLQNNSHSRKR